MTNIKDTTTSGSSEVPTRIAKNSTKNAADGKRNVYIWDMDETLILLKCLVNGTYAEAFNGLKDLQKGIEIGKAWEDHILRVCDNHFFYEQIENHNTPTLHALTQYDDGRELSDYDFSQDGFSSLHDDSSKRKLAYRHRAAVHKYKLGLQGILDQGTVEVLNDLYAVTDTYTDRWFSSAQKLLEEISGSINDSNGCLASANVTPESADTKIEHIHVIVTSGSLIPSLAKCLLFRLDHLIPHENVYSSLDVGKVQCFSWIEKRFDGPNTQFCVIGDGWEECEGAQAMKWPFVKIDPHQGGGHSFPGLTPKTLNYYLSVVYGNSDTEI